MYIEATFQPFNWTEELGFFWNRFTLDPEKQKKRVAWTLKRRKKRARMLDYEFLFVKKGGNLLVVFFDVTY